MNNIDLKVRKRGDIKTIKRYTNVALELPEGAKNVLSSRMGKIEVSAKDSFERYLIERKNMIPKYDYVTFQKIFAEKFDRKAISVLKKIKENRENGKEYYVDNEYFWTEFDDMFEKISESKRYVTEVSFKLEKLLGEYGNRFLSGISGLRENISRVGIRGIGNLKYMLGKNAKVREVKWR